MPLYPPPPSYYPVAADKGTYLTESFPGYVAQGSTIPGTAGRVEFVKLKLLTPASVTNIVMHVVTAGSTLTSGQCFAALYTGAGSLVGVTADQAVAWASGGFKTMALASGPFAMAAGYCFVAFWHNGTTAPAWARGANLNSGLINGTLATPNFFAGTADTSITTTAPPTLGAQTAAAAMWWAGLT